MKIFLDSDVVIAGLISSTGAGNFILKNCLGKKTVKIFTSLKQINEIKKVLNNPQFVWPTDLKLWQDFRQKAKKIKLDKKILKTTLKFVNDPHDNHILTGCILAKTRFLLTYNLKDYKKEKIKDKFNLLIVNPGYFLQFLRLKT